MMENKCQLVAWTKNTADKKNARLYLAPYLERELRKPFDDDIEKYRKGEWDSIENTRRLAGAYERSARFEILTGHIGDGIRLLLDGANACLFDDGFDSSWADCDSQLGRYTYFRGKLRREFRLLCKEAVSIAEKYGLEHILDEYSYEFDAMGVYRAFFQEEKDLMKHKKEVSPWLKMKRTLR